MAACGRLMTRTTAGARVSYVEPATVAGDFVGSALRTDQGHGTRPAASDADGSADPYAAAIADAVTAESYRFRWQTSASASAFVGMSLGDLDLDGERVLGSPEPGSQRPEPASTTTHRVAGQGGRRG